MKILIFFIVALSSLSVNAMSSRPFFGPSVRYENLSNKPLSNVQAKIGKKTSIETNLSPGQGFVATNYIMNKNDMYGDAIVRWTNNEGEEFSKEFIFTEHDLPKKYILEEDLSDSIVFEFTQDDVQYYTGAAPDYWERGKKSAAMRSKIRLEIDKKKRNK